MQTGLSSYVAHHGWHGGYETSRKHMISRRGEIYRHISSPFRAKNDAKEDSLPADTLLDDASHRTGRGGKANCSSFPDCSLHTLFIFTVNWPSLFTTQCNFCFALPSSALLIPLFLPPHGADLNRRARIQVRARCAAELLTTTLTSLTSPHPTMTLPL